MRTVRRLIGVGPGAGTDAGIAVAAAGLVAVAAWGPASLAGTTVTGPPWARALLPLVVGAPLVLRRRAPLLMWAALWVVIAVQDRINSQPLQGLEFLLVLVAAGYSLGTYAPTRRGVAGLAISAVMVGASAGTLHPGGYDVGLSAVPVLASWLAGVLARTRRQSASLARHNAALRQQAEQAAANERIRIARELHDIVAHHLSVIVLQAAGARASGRFAEATLGKIEKSGRQALADTRRLLGVLRDGGESSGLEPFPGVGELDALADTVRAAGLPVNLVIDGEHTALPTAVDVSVYRIVQEGLTNVLKHAGPARADVAVGCARDAVTIQITDNGTMESVNQTGGHGLAGMRERAALFGGELYAGPRPGGGFAVRARLPMGDEIPLRDEAL